MICKICGKDFKVISRHIRRAHKMSPKEYYDKFLKKPGEGICPVTGKPTKFKNIQEGYYTYAGCGIANRDPVIREKTKQTCLKRYRVESPNQSPIVKEKKKQTYLEHYGVQSPIQSPIVKQKINYLGDKLLGPLRRLFDRLIHIFEDEWIFKKDIVKSRLKHILGKTEDLTHIGARECTIKEISIQEKNNFLEQYHIQGPDSSNVKLGAFYQDQLVAVMTFSHGSLAKGIKHQDPLIWELNRFCTHSGFVISGIASKLLDHFKKNYEWKEIFSYADRRWSDGNLYKQLGFELEHITHPNYWYVRDFRRTHRFALRKRPNEPTDIPEWVLRLKEGYVKVWDCGNLKFRLINEKTLPPN